MKRIGLAILISAVGIGSAAAAGDLTWVFNHDDTAGYAGVVATADKDKEEPHYSFLLSCSQEDDWALYLSDLDVKALGDTIAKNEQPSFTLVSTKGGKSETSDPYYPELSYNQEEARWEYSADWDTDMLAKLVGADRLAIKGTGVDLPLPTQAMQDSLGKLKAFCDKLNSADDAAGNDDSGSSQ
jgi:hypothetical protein